MDLIRVIIADDQTITRSGPRTLLATFPQVEVVGEAASGRDAIVLAPHVGILVVTAYGDDTLVFPAIRAGARSYLLKDADQAELLRAIQTVALGASFSVGALLARCSTSWRARHRVARHSR